MSRASADAAEPIAPPSPTGETRFVTSEIFRQPAFGRNHPLSIARQSGVLDLCEQLGWLEPDCQLTCEPATRETLIRFHDPAYVHALKHASDRGLASVEDRERYAFGTMENPLFGGLFERAATTVDDV